MLNCACCGVGLSGTSRCCPNCGAIYELIKGAAQQLEEGIGLLYAPKTERKFTRVLKLIKGLADELDVETPEQREIWNRILAMTSSEE
jgi:hypothetical protein